MNNKSKVPEDLLKIYDAVANSTFSGCSHCCAERLYTKEEAAHIAYFKMLEEYRHGHALRAGPVRRPLAFTRVVGPFATRLEKNQVASEIKDKIAETVSIKEHKHMGRCYLVVQSEPWIASVIDTFPKTQLLLSSPSVHIMCLDNSPANFPDEVVISKHPTDTVCLLNVIDTEEEILQFFSDWRMRLMVYRENRVYIRLATKKDASLLHEAMAGCLVNGRNVFVLYYPDCLSDINLFL